jgi:hypothetical protein
MAVLIAGSFYDITYDGQIYHQFAIDKLAHNWNPIKEKTDNIWVDHYAKSPWIAAASLNQIVPRIEFAKAFNWAFIFGSFMLSGAALLSLPGLKIYEALGISAIAAFNPIAIYQSLSFYIDGQLASLLVALTATFTLLLTKQLKSQAILPYINIIILLVNTKFTSLVYATIAIMGFAAYLFLLSFRQKLNRREVYRFSIISLCTIGVSVFMVGYNPYVTNTLNQGHPFYPLAGKGAVDIITPNQPIPLQGKSSIHQLLISIFAKPGNYLPEFHQSEEVTLQFPLLLDSKSLEVFQFADARIGGFGPFFNVLFVLGLVLTGILLAAKIPHRQWLVMAIAILWLTVLVNPAAWWARYIPQLWLFPLFPVILTLASDSQHRLKRIAPGLAWFILLLGVLNILLVGQIHFSHNLQATQEINAFMAQIHQVKQPLLLKQNYLFWNAPLIRLREQNIDYRLIGEAKLPCPNPAEIPYSGISYCASSQNP